MIAEDDDRTDSVRNRGRRTYVLPDRRNGGLSVVSLVPWLDQNPLFSLSLSLPLFLSLSLSLSFYLLPVEARVEEEKQQRMLQRWQ